MKNINSNKGFTLIELLVVIAIIGILGTVVLSSLNSSRDKGYESQIIQQLTAFRSGAEIYYYAQSPAGYGVANSCDSGMFINTDSAQGRPGATIDPSVLPASDLQRVCASTARAYAVKIASYNQNGYWCVDSKGTLKFYEGAIGDPATQCPAI